MTDRSIAGSKLMTFWTKSGTQLGKQKKEFGMGITLRLTTKSQESFKEPGEITLSWYFPNSLQTKNILNYKTYVLWHTFG